MPLIAEDAEGGVGSGDNQCFLENNCSREQLFSRTTVHENNSGYLDTGGYGSNGNKEIFG